MSIEELEKLLTGKSYRPSSDLIQAAVAKNPTVLLPYLVDRFTGTKLEGIVITTMVLGNIARANPACMQPYQERLYKSSIAHFHPGVRRNVIRYFSEIPVLLEDDHPVPKWVKSKDFLYCRSSKVLKQIRGPFYIEPELEGYLLEHLIEIIADPQEIAAPKAFGMSLGKNLCLKYPEITNELIPVIEEAMKYGTAAVKNRGAKVVSLLERLIED